MSLTTRISALLMLATARPWQWGETTPVGRNTLAQVVRPDDAELAVLCVNSAAHWLALYRVAGAIHARSVLGFTYLRAADRNALRKALTDLES